MKEMNKQNKQPKKHLEFFFSWPHILSRGAALEPIDLYSEMPLISLSQQLSIAYNYGYGCGSVPISSFTCFHFSSFNLLQLFSGLSLSLRVLFHLMTLLPLCHPSSLALTIFLSPLLHTSLNLEELFRVEFSKVFCFFVNLRLSFPSFYAMII